MLLYEGLEPIGRCCSTILCLDGVSLPKALFWPYYPDIDSVKTSQHTDVWRSGFNEYREGWPNPVTYGYWVRDNKGLLSMSMGFISGGRFNSLFDVGGGNNVKVINQTNPIIPPNPGENPFPRDGHDLAEEIKRLEGQIELTNIKASYSEANGFKGFYNSGDMSGEISSGVGLIFEYNQILNSKNHIVPDSIHVYGEIRREYLVLILKPACSSKILLA